MSDDNKPQQSGPPNFNELEQGILKFWEENQTFQKSLEQTKNGEPYIFYDGPPFATGTPHYGSLLSSIIKDAVGRYQTMKGKYVRRRWGWDCHGLPIENIVEQNLKISGKKQIEEIGVERFNKVCRDNVLKYAEEWGKTINRIGRWVEFENSYKTMDTSYMESVWWGLKQIWDKGLIYEDRKVLLYCSRCETPISNFEVAMDNSYREVTERSVYAKFKIRPRQRLINDLIDEKTFALAWTTTPWTLPGNTSLNIGPDIKYVMVESTPAIGSGEKKPERYIVAKDRLSVLKEPYEIVAEYEARQLEGLEYEPLYPGVIPDSYHEVAGARLVGGDPKRAHRIYLADFVTTTDGTGIVHNAAMYGEEDYQLAKEKELPRLDMLDHKGQYLPMAPENLRGVFFKDADKIVITELSGKGLLYEVENFTHSYPHCHRCGTPLFYNALPAWFINIQKIKQQLLKTNEDINWYPEHLKYGRFAKSAEQAPDWNISRNRYWATALPFWKCQNEQCRNVVCVGSIEELRTKSTNFSEVYPNFDPANLEMTDLHKPYIDMVKLKCEKCETQMNRIPEVVDCWVESGSMPFAELHYPFQNSGEVSPEDFKKRFPADFVAEYIPQTRAWFYVMHVISNILFERAPFKNVVTTGTVLAEDGSKMSKSKKNYPEPSLVIDRYGADAIRFYLLACPVMNAEDVNFSEKSVQDVNRKVSLLMYNMLSFIRLYSKEKFDAQKPSSTHVLDRWINIKLSELQKEVTKQMDGYNTVKAAKALVDFINDLSTWYVRRSRDRMKSAHSTSSGPSAGQDSQIALATLAYVLVEVSKMLAPFMPFLSEYIYKDLTGKTSVHLEKWSAATDIATAAGPEATRREDLKLLEQMQWVREVVSVGLAWRKTSKMAVRQPLRAVNYKVAISGKAAEALPKEFEGLILEELNVKTVDAGLNFNEAQSTHTEIFGSNSVSITFDSKLTDELKQEGVARELERAVQDLRKKSGLKVGELVDVYYNTQDEKLEQALVEIFDRKKTFVSQIQKSLEVEVDYESQNVVDGKAIWLGMIKI